MLRANGLPRPRPPAAGAAGAAPRAAACPDPGVGLRPSITGGAQSGQGAVSQTPDKSGLPLAARGAGALRSVLPSAVFGTEPAGYAGHCACSEATATSTATLVANA